MVLYWCPAECSGCQDHWGRAPGHDRVLETEAEAQQETWDRSFRQIPGYLFRSQQEMRKTDNIAFD